MTQLHTPVDPNAFFQVQPPAAGKIEACTIAAQRDASADENDHRAGQFDTLEEPERWDGMS